MIYFVDGLNAMVVKALQDSSDWADILNDLRRIDDKLRCGSGTEEDAYELDYELRNKYPAIHAMLQIADTFPVLSSSHHTRTAGAAESPIMTRRGRIIVGFSAMQRLKQVLNSVSETVLIMSSNSEVSPK